MSACILNFPSDRPAVCRAFMVAEPDYLTLDGHGDQQFVTDWQLGNALGYANPTAAVEQLFAKHAVELGWHSLLVNLHQSEHDGRTRVRVFDLEGAMRVCKLAKTPAAGLLYARLGAMAIADFAVDVGSGAGPRAPVIPLPLCRPLHRCGKGAYEAETLSR
ncbi:hypothetical protein [Pseudomonas leptonychotis]|uniref:hypothetical protein n=1 Tax=Pseudomonas leptonychotis TaxID=2448482 RepID=UPI0038698046